MINECFEFDAQGKRKAYWRKKHVVVSGSKLSYYKEGNETDKKCFYLDSLQYSVKIDNKQKDYTFCFFKECELKSK